MEYCSRHFFNDSPSTGLRTTVSFKAKIFWLHCTLLKNCLEFWPNFRLNVVEPTIVVALG